MSTTPAMGLTSDHGDGWRSGPFAGVVDTAIDLGGYAIGQHQAPSVIEAMEASEYFGKN